jgi:DNA repair protein RecN (Recombination protein N)
LAITHLPQVAAAGERQYVLEKDVAQDGIARTAIREVVDVARVDELCRMLGTTSDDAAARSHVERLLRGVGVAS